MNQVLPGPIPGGHPSKMPQATPTDIKVMRLLSERGRATCTQVGETIWGGGVAGKARDRQHYARPAGRALHRLQRVGLVVMKQESSKTFFRHWWHLTIKGKARVQASENPL